MYKLNADKTLASHIGASDINNKSVRHRSSFWCSEAVAQRCSVKKVFLEISQSSGNDGLTKEFYCTF